MVMLAPVLSPHGVLTLAPSLAPEEAPALSPERGLRLEKAFARGCGHGLLVLGADEVGTTLPPTLSYWRKFAARYVTVLCALPGIGERKKPPVPIPADGELDTMAAAVPPMTGAEYLTTEVLAKLWRATDSAFDAELAQSNLTVQEFLKSRHPAWNLVGRVHFNLAENRKDEEAPFAFLATYTTRLSAAGQSAASAARQGLREYAGASEPRAAALAAAARAARRRALRLAESHGGCGRDFSSAALDARRGAPASSRDVAAARNRRRRRAHAGDLAREPPCSPAGDRQRSAATRLRVWAWTRCSTSAWRSPSTARRSRAAEIKQSAGAFRRLVADPRPVGRGGPRKARAACSMQFEAIEQRAAEDGLSFDEAMRMLAGAAHRRQRRLPGRPPTGREIVAGPWLAETLQRLAPARRGWRGRSRAGNSRPTLRPYQQAGVRWLYLLARLGLGACLADDMGLGKTIQVLSLLLVLKRGKPREPRKPSLLVAPASLLANWAAEIERFAPSLTPLIAHPSVDAGG